MYDSPITLQELCLDCICINHESIFEAVYGEAPLECNLDDKSPAYDNNKIQLKFPDPDVYLFSEIAEKLLQKFNDKHLLDDCTLSIFCKKNTKLKNVRIQGGSKITKRGLRVLSEHNLNGLECIEMNQLNVEQILSCLNQQTVVNLTNLNVSGCTFIDLSRYIRMGHLTDLKKLKSLNVSFTEFNQQTLQMICEDLRHLQKLNISGTCVQCLKPLLNIKETLISLTASDLKYINQMTEHIIELHNLRHLDISLIYEKFDALQNTAICDILESPDKLPHLAYLDISGWRDLIPKNTLQEFLDSHRKLKFLGLVRNPIAFEVFLSEPSNDCELQIAGLGNEQQIKTTLKKHYDRHEYVQKALYHLFQLSGSFANSRADILELLLPAMEAHPTRFGVQMAATACLYNLTRGDISKDLHPQKYLCKAVHLTLNAMETFPDEYQLQKNGLLTLCSDRILQEVQFDKFRCARIVLDSLCAFEELHMNRMSVAICSILAARISTKETSALGGKEIYMRKLLAMVQSRVDSKNSDITMRFTLSALWNLTDESITTCEVFLANEGAQLFLKVLAVFKKEVTVETKVLGLLNNIAEVEDLRRHLMMDALMVELYGLLMYDTIDVSYFAAGIVAHLASDGEDKWTVEGIRREQMLEALEKAVMAWGTPDGEMVAYRSFKPFFPLLRRGVDHRVQLWAAWAVHHVCSKNPSRYCEMFNKESGVELLSLLIESPDCYPTIREICTEVLNFFVQKDATATATRRKSLASGNNSDSSNSNDYVPQV